MGDLNIKPIEEHVLVLKNKLKDAFDNITTIPYGPISAFNGFDHQAILLYAFTMYLQKM